MDAQTWYTQHKIGDGRVGFGERPAILVIDMQNDFLDDGCFLYLGPESQQVIPPIQRLLTLAREGGVPVIYTQQIHRPDFADGGRWADKFTGFKEAGLREGTPGVQIVDELEPQPGDLVVKKRRPSGFFQTDMDVYLRSLGVDTIILTGCTTSGCVRATALDAFSFNYRLVLPRECVADRAKEPHEANLFDINMKLGDVVPLAEVMAYLEMRVQAKA